jgi:preprotein translocase subunit SecG
MFRIYQHFKLGNTIQRTFFLRNITDYDNFAIVDILYTTAMGCSLCFAMECGDFCYGVASISFSYLIFHVVPSGKYFTFLFGGKHYEFDNKHITMLLLVGIFVKYNTNLFIGVIAMELTFQKMIYLSKEKLTSLGTFQICVILMIVLNFFIMMIMEIGPKYFFWYMFERNDRVQGAAQGMARCTILLWFRLCVLSLALTVFNNRQNVKLTKSMSIEPPSYS